MPYSSGTFTFTSNAFAPSPTTLTTISSPAATSTWSELATALTTAWLKDGTQTVTANIPMASFRITGSGGIQYTVGAALTATGTLQSDAYAITLAVNEFTTVAASTGATLPTAAVGMTIVIYNGGANPLAVYPHSGASINGLTANAAMTLMSATAVSLTCVSTTRWVGVLSA